MKLTPQETSVFNSLGTSESGAVLIGYIERLIATLCDIRTLGDVSEDARKGRLELVKVLEEELIAPMKLQNKQKDTNNAQYV